MVESLRAPWWTKIPCFKGDTKGDAWGIVFYAEKVACCHFYIPVLRGLILAGE